jgi:molybdenum cofactor synthesis domain-containing protein
MRPFTSTIPFAEARRLLLDAATPIDATETTTIGEADGRVAAGTMVAQVDVPAFDRAAMDGYAVIAADTAGASPLTPRTLACVGQVLTGEVPTRAVRAGECVAIATGAPMPDGADAVLIVEDTARRDGAPDRIEVRASVAAGQHIGRRGADLAAGQTVVSGGQVLTPSRVGALAATGVARLDVYRRPSVAVFVTGDEIADPGAPLRPGQVYNVNRFTLEAIVRRHGGVPVPQRTVGDTLAALDAAVDAAAAYGLLVFSGGSSVGEHDLVIDILRTRGEVVFHGVAVKPGKPTAFGRIGRTPVLGLPGYPTSCLSNAYMLLVPFLRKMARLPDWTPRRVDVPLGRRIASTPGRHQFYTVRIENGQAEPAFKSSGDITSMANADGYMEIPAWTESVEAGMVVTVTLFD